MRSYIFTAFPQTTLSGAPALTPAYLASIDVLVIASPTSTGGTAAPLTVDEQNAVRGFVIGGGTALLFIDNPDFVGANASMTAAFGIGVSSVRDDGTATFVPGVASQVQSGPFGTVSSFEEFDAGAFSSPGPDGQVAATFWNGLAALVHIPNGQLGPGSGSVTAFADTSMLLDGTFLTQQNRTVVLNAIASGVPHYVRSDWDGDGHLSVADIFLFLNDWFYGCDGQPAAPCHGRNADFDRSGALGVADVFEFLNAWFAGI
jgi:hypothetical protein